MRQQLMALEEEGTPIRVAVIGCGRFGSMVISQLAHAPGMEASIACDLDVRRASDALAHERRPRIRPVKTNDVGKANDALNKGRHVATDDSAVAINAEVDVVVDATGNPDIAAKHAYDVIMAGKHVVMVSVEADVLVGPILKDMADQAGVVYTAAYGDQPAIIEELVDWAVSMGFDVVAAGKGTKHRDDFRYLTPDQALLEYGMTPEQIESSSLNPRMYNSFLDTTKSSIEMCAVANMTGLVPDVPGMHFPSASVDDIPRLLIPAEDGGILNRQGVVEIVSCLDGEGNDIPGHLRWGVFVVITSRSEYLRGCMKDYGMAMDPTGRYAVMYRPYHLIGMETPVSIAKAVLYGEATGAPKGRVCEVVATAKKDLAAGEVLDGEGGYTVHGSIVEAAQADGEGLAPIGLCHGATVVRSVSRGQMLSAADVQLPEGGFAAHLRAVQNAV
ncbi:MAG: flagellar biosynthesis protein FlgA [Dehalococcoidia bacterium]|nr:flagellar biosynthesis protein FlgA [Dehalococcoidia bacterium]